MNNRRNQRGINNLKPLVTIQGIREMLSLKKGINRESSFITVDPR
jgi:hypothetical protein